MCDTLSALSTRFGDGKGGCHIDLCAFVVSVMASVMAYYICKWLDGDESDN